MSEVRRGIIADKNRSKDPDDISAPKIETRASTNDTATPETEYARKLEADRFLELEAQLKYREHTIREFRAAIEERMRDLPVKEFIEAVRDFLKEISEPETPLEAAASLEAISHEIRKLASRLKKETRPQFEKWLQKEMRDKDSGIARLIQNWNQEFRLSEVAEKASTRLIFLELGSEMTEGHLDSIVIERVKTVENKLLELSAAPPFPAEQIFEAFLIEQAWQKTEIEKARKKSIFERLFGTKEVTAENQLQEVLRDLDKTYAGSSDQNGMNPAERIKHSISPRRFTDKGRNDIGTPNFEIHKKEEIIEHLKSVLEGKEKIFQEPITTPTIEGYEQFANKFHLPKNFKGVIEALKPILGRSDLVRKIIFANHERNGTSLHNLGLFDPKKRTLTIYPSEQPQPAEQTARTLAHESGHAMQLEKTLPLEEAISFAVEIVEVIVRTGYISRYSELAKNVYALKLQESGMTPSMMTKRDYAFLDDSDIREEWAEIVAFALTPCPLHELFPEKEDMVRRYLARLGIDLAEAQNMAAEAIWSEAPEVDGTRRRTLRFLAVPREPEETIQAVEKLSPTQPQ